MHLEGYPYKTYALVKQYDRLLEMDGYGLKLKKKPLMPSPKMAIARKNRCRGLRGIMEKLMTNIMPSEKDVTKSA